MIEMNPFLFVAGFILPSVQLFKVGSNSDNSVSFSVSWWDTKDFPVRTIGSGDSSLSPRLLILHVLRPSDDVLHSLLLIIAMLFLLARRTEKHFTKLAKKADIEVRVGELVCMLAPDAAYEV